MEVSVPWFCQRQESMHMCVWGGGGCGAKLSYLQGSYLRTGHEFVWGKSLDKLGRKRVKL